MLTKCTEQLLYECVAKTTRDETVNVCVSACVRLIHLFKQSWIR